MVVEGEKDYIIDYGDEKKKKNEKRGKWASDSYMEGENESE